MSHDVENHPRHSNAAIPDPSPELVATMHLAMDPPGTERKLRWSVYYNGRRVKGVAAHSWDALESIQYEVNRIRLEIYRKCTPLEE
jgi:hypothetical protein